VLPGDILLYYESIKREIQTRPINECRYDERLKTKDEESTHLTYTGVEWELEHLKITTRLIDEKFPSVMGECVIVTLTVCLHRILPRGGSGTVH
jgi:hypothetical protein